jgi:hydroxypyruvate reductase
MDSADVGSHARALQVASLAAVDPRRALARHVRLDGSLLTVAGREYDLDGYRDLYVAAGGKATVPLVSALCALLGDRITAGVGVTKYGHAEASGHGAPIGLKIPPVIEIIEAGHPLPDGNSVRGARAVIDLAHRAGERDLIICLLSGGGSALLTLPRAGLDLQRVQAITQSLLRSGATIGELNTVRKHWSLIKGGGLARAAAPATVVALALSDVVGDPLDVIASGPTVPDPTSIKEARSVLRKRGVERPDEIPLAETPKPGDPVFDRVQTAVIGSNRLAALAAVEKARELGYRALYLGSYIEGEAREVAIVAAGLAKGARQTSDPLQPPACMVWGGETTVTVRGSGRGGRNTELALAASIALDGWPGILLMALATDGTDGPTDCAGAVATGDTLRRARALGLDPWASLQDNDSYSFFAALGDLIHTGPTGTNVNDLLFILVA